MNLTRAFIPATCALVLVASGCAKQKVNSQADAGASSASGLTAAQAIDSQGRCTAAFLHAYNQVAVHAATVKAVIEAQLNARMRTGATGASAMPQPTPVPDSVTSLRRACTRLFGASSSAVGGSTSSSSLSCTALVNGQRTTISSTSHAPLCQAAAAARSQPTSASGASGLNGLPSDSGQSSEVSEVDVPIETSPARLSTATTKPISASGPAFGMMGSAPSNWNIPNMATLDAVASNGTCTPAFVTGYTTLLSAPGSQAPNQARQLAAVCGQFLSALSRVTTCSAVINGVPEVISSRTISQHCAQATGQAF